MKVDEYKDLIEAIGDHVDACGGNALATGEEVMLSRARILNELDLLITESYRDGHDDGSGGVRR
jgi:hypothetical protein